MQATNYQAPKLSILRLEVEDVIITSGGVTPNDKAFDKGVEDLF